MIKLLKKYFIPHHANDHKPHFLRYENIRALVIAIIIIELLFIIAPLFSFLKIDTSKFMASVLPSVVASFTNQNREEQNLPDLKDNSLLDQAAQLKAQDMVDNGYFAHVSPAGKAPWYWFKQVGYKYEYAGENLAVDFSDSKDVTDAWMKSPTHRANIVKAAYTEVGTGIASGMFEGKETTFVVQMYASPKAAASDAVESAPVQESKPIPEEPRLAVAPKQDAPTPTLPVQPQVLGAEDAPQAAADVSLADSRAPESVQAPVSVPQQNKAVSFIKQSLSSPRHTVNTLLVLLGIIAIIALFLKLMIRVDVQHPILITNGLVLVALVIGLFTANINIGKFSVPVIGSGAAVTAGSTPHTSS